MARDVLVILTYPVDDFDTLRTVTDHQCRFYAISSPVDLVGQSYRIVPVSGPSCIMPFAGCRFIRRVGFLVDAVNVHFASMIAANQFLRGRCRWSKTKKKHLLQSW